MYSVKEIVSLFTDHFRKDDGSNIYKIASLFSDELQLTKETNDLILEWRDIDKAQGKALDLIGRNINQFRGVATDEVYRILLKSKIARNLSDGTIDTIIEVIATALSADKSEIKIKEGWEVGKYDRPSIEMMQLPLVRLLESGIDPINFVRIIQKTVSAGVKVETVELEGTFELGTVALQQDTDEGLSDIDMTTGGTLGAMYSTDDIVQLPI